MENQADASGGRGAASVPIVGVGASAGGVGALKAFFSAVPPGSRIAFVVVVHLQPDKESALPEIVERFSSLPTSLVTEETAIEAGHVYVIAPGAVLTVKEGRLRTVGSVGAMGHRNAVDNLLASLAVDQGERAACVILSGTGSDGTLGLRAIKEHGGLALAQEAAEFDGMMHSAVATGLVDLVLPAEALARKLLDYFGDLSGGDADDPDPGRREVLEHMQRVCALVRERTGHDFGNYKDRTIVRRIQRRMQVLQIDTGAAYLERLRSEPRELDRLFRDMLIGVTSFFRDPEAFEALERHVIKPLVTSRGPDAPIRIWAPACSTGEEAYSLAILLHEQATAAGKLPRFQIFASDIDERALEVARVGRYPATIADQVAEARLARYFVREDGTYRVIGDLRESILFSSHDLLRDPPFSRIDLVSCRNLLIYLNPDLQDRVIPLFSYALRRDGYLFLGSSENVSRHGRLFADLDKGRRIFQRRTEARARLPQFPLTPHSPRRSDTPPRHEAPDASLRGAAERRLLDRFAPAHAVINAAGEVLHISGRTGKYLELPAGTPDNNLFAMSRPGLRGEIRATLQRAASTGRTARQGGVTIGDDGGRQEIDLVVDPLRLPGQPEPLYLVVFRDVGAMQPEIEPAREADDDASQSGALRRVEAELSRANDRLLATSEELESSNEELKSANEELSLINEELQSSNEELETSREELSSMNEELQTVNAELSTRVEELSRANSDIQNLLESTQIATVFLDRDLRIKTFTPRAKELFHLVESDEGRPIGHLRSRFTTDTLREDAERVLSGGDSVERVVRSDESGLLYAMRILPYRVNGNVISGVVATFVDITRISRAETRIDELTRDLRNRLESLETLLDLVPAGIFMTERDADWRMSANRAAVRFLGQDETTPTPRVLAEDLPLLRGRRPIPRDAQPLARAARGETVRGFEAQVAQADERRLDVIISATPLFDEAGSVRGAIAAMVDITERKQAEEHQEMLLHELQHRVKNILATIVALSARMMKSSDTLEGFAENFTGRLHAMARTHELLSQGRWQGAELADVVKLSLTPYQAQAGANIRLDGPPLVLRPKVAAALGMIFHELASNAAKYGALATDEGTVEVSWRLVGKGTDETVSLMWKESGGPPVASPKRKGFGSSFILRSAGYELSGEASLDFEKDGVLCMIEFPMGRARPDEPPPSPGSGHGE